VLADRDVIDALDYIRTLSSAPDRNGLTIAVAGAYGRQNPNTALAWIDSLSPSLPGTRDAVIQGIAESDLDRAVDLALAEMSRQTRGRPTMLPNFMSRIFSSGSGDAAQLMSRLLDTANTDIVVDQAFSMWVQTDRDAATAWAFDHADRLDRDTMADLARDIAQADRASAERVLESLPPERRGNWLAGIAAELARADLDEAMAFVERYRGQPGYPEGLNAVLLGWASVDPVHAASLLAAAGQPPAGEALVMITGSWVQLDPEAASAWAVGLADEELRNRAVRAVVMSWGQGGGAAAGARDWLLGLPRGPTRDAGLDMLLFGGPASGAASGTLNPTLLDAYSSDVARQQGVGRAAVMIGRRNADAARQLVEAHITDPEIRQRTDELLAQPNAQAAILEELLGVDAR
jgi:hypothetical protein